MLGSVGAYGNLGSKSIELVQNGYHLFRGRYLAFPKPSLNRKARLMFLMGLFDTEVRKAFRNYIKSAFKNPIHLLKKVYVQSIIVEQPFDILPNGEQDMCDGCPNKTLWKEQLVPACILEEYLNYGIPAVAVPKSK